MVKIISIEPDSIAGELGIQPGGVLISINDKPINDRLDYRFYSTDENIEVRIKHGDDEIIYDIEKEADEDIGLVLEEMKIKVCGNNCIFCFVCQNPKGMRKPLYFKDEDYRFSFLYGHYITMTNLKQKDLERIVEQRLSPLYISVHSTEEKTRKLLLGIKRDDHLLKKIEYLTRNGIELHAQIVLCPDINDGAVLERTVHDLKSFYPRLKSIAVVPVGLTRHRENLAPLRTYTPKEIPDIITHTDQMRAGLKKELGLYFVYLADEFFIKSQTALPSSSYYDDFYQIENGVGEFRQMIENFNQELPFLRDCFKENIKITWVTGALAKRPLEEHIINPLRKIGNFEIDLIAVKNDFYGQSVEVSGLLTADDILNQLKYRDLGQMVLLPPRILNNDGLFLDDWTTAYLEQKLGVPVHVFKESFIELKNIAETLRSTKIAV